MPRPDTSGEIIYEWICQSASLVYFLTPVIEIIRITRSSGKVKMNVFPLPLLIIIMLNCLFWCLIGWFDNEKWISMLVSNTIGLFVNLCLLFGYLYLSLKDGLEDRKRDYNLIEDPNKQKAQWNPVTVFYIQFIGYGLFMMNVLIEIAYLMYRYIIKDHLDDTTGVLDIIGFIAMILNMLMYASPIVNVFKMISHKSEKYMPIVTNSCGFVCCVLWLVYGFVIKSATKSDQARTIYSNLASLVLIVFQISFWVIYYCKRKRNKEDVETDIPNEPESLTGEK